MQKWIGGMKKIISMGFFRNQKVLRNYYFKILDQI